MTKNFNLVHVFLLLLRGLELGSNHSTSSVLLEATNYYINERWFKDKEGCPLTRKNCGRPEGVCIEPAANAGGYVTEEKLITMIGINSLIGYYRSFELPLYWEQQPNSGHSLGIIQR